MLFKQHQLKTAGTRGDCAPWNSDTRFMVPSELRKWCSLAKCSSRAWGDPCSDTGVFRFKSSRVGRIRDHVVVELAIACGKVWATIEAREVDSMFQLCLVDDSVVERVRIAGWAPRDSHAVVFKCFWWWCFGSGWARDEFTGLFVEQFARAVVAPLSSAHVEGREPRFASDGAPVERVKSVAGYRQEEFAGNQPPLGRKDADLG
jgi:hypothetical protein